MALLRLALYHWLDVKIDVVLTSDVLVPNASFCIDLVSNQSLAFVARFRTFSSWMLCAMKSSPLEADGGGRSMASG